MIWNLTELELSTPNKVHTYRLIAENLAFTSAEDRVQFAASANKNELEKFGYSTADDTNPIITENVGGLCVWLTEKLNLSAGFEIACVLITCCLIALIWFWLVRGKQVRQQLSRVEKELQVLLPDCCGQKQQQQQDEHQSNQQIPLRKQPD